MCVQHRTYFTLTAISPSYSATQAMGEMRKRATKAEAAYNALKAKTDGQGDGTQGPKGEAEAEEQQVMAADQSGGVPACSTFTAPLS